MNDLICMNITMVISMIYSNGATGDFTNGVVTLLPLLLPRNTASSLESIGNEKKIGQVFKSRYHFVFDFRLNSWCDPSVPGLNEVNGCHG